MGSDQEVVQIKDYIIEKRRQIKNLYHIKDSFDLQKDNFNALIRKKNFGTDKWQPLENLKNGNDIQKLL